MIAKPLGALFAFSLAWCVLYAVSRIGSAADREDSPGAATAAPGPAISLNSSQARWHRLKIRAVWSETHPGESELSPADLDAIMAGDYDRLNDGSINHQKLVLSGIPDLRPTPAGMLLAGGIDGFWPHCSVVLASPDTVVTAAHCVRGLSPQTLFKVYFPYEGIRDVAIDGITQPCTDRASPCPDDLAIIGLSAPYSFTPVAKQGAADLAVPGSAVRTLGFGVSSQILFDNGMLHEGRVVVGECSCGTRTTDRVLCFSTRYGSGTPGPPQYANFSGDSGGPMFAEGAPGFSLVGIANGIETACGGAFILEGRYADTRKGISLPWLSQAFCNSDCAQRPEREFDVLLSLGLAYVDSKEDSKYRITVPERSARLLLTLNHELNGFHPEPGGDLDIEMPDSLEEVCTRYYGVETCEVQNPPPGDYIIGIKTVTGNPAYQLTAVAILE